MICEKCKGRGRRENPRYHGCQDIGWHEPMICCRACGGSGFIVGNLREVLDVLKVIRNGGSYRKEDIEQAIKVIEEEQPKAK